jgi:hypothetical protein
MANVKKKDPVTDSVTATVTKGSNSEAKTPELTVVEKAEPITMHRMAAEVEVNTVWRMTVKQDVTPEQCMDEAFWCHVSLRLIPGDTLIVRPDDSSWQLTLNVINAGPQFAQVHKVSFHELVPFESRDPLPSIYKVEYAGTVHKWRFLREGKMMRDGFASEALANRAAQQHQMAVNRSTPK